MNDTANHPHFTDPELVMLSLANSGEYLIKCPVTIGLAKRGFMYAADPVNYAITAEGKQAIKAVAEQEASEQSAAFRGIADGHKTVRQMVILAAKTLVLAAQASHELTGEAVETSLKKWLIEVETLALAEVRK